MTSLFKKQAKLVAFLIFEWRTGCDQPQGGPAGEVEGLCWKTPHPPARKHNWWRYPAPFYNQTSVFLTKQISTTSTIK